MTIPLLDLKHAVIHPVLQDFGADSPIMENLLLLTALLESYSAHQTTTLHGFGIYQISSDTHQTIWDQYLSYNPEFASKIRGYASQWHFLQQPDLELISNLSYATLIAWCLYLYSHAALPQSSEFDDLYQCWLNFYPGKKCQKPLFQSNKYYLQMQQCYIEVAQ